MDEAWLDSQMSAVVSKNIKVINTSDGQILATRIEDLVARLSNTSAAGAAMIIDQAYT